MTRQQAHDHLINLIASGEFEEACCFRDSIQDAGIKIPAIGWDDVKHTDRIFTMILDGHEPSDEDFKLMLLYDLAAKSQLVSNN